MDLLARIEQLREMYHDGLITLDEMAHQLADAAVEHLESDCDDENNS